MKRIMVLDSDYPSDTNLYGDVFVHTRVKEYQKTATVQVVSFFRNLSDYEYEGVFVRHAPYISDLQAIYEEFQPNIIFIHFYNRKLYPFIKTANVPIAIWVHGYEALGWYRRLFNYSAYQIIRNLHNIVLPNVRQMLGFRKLVKFSNKNENVHFVFVSDWMRRVAETDSLTKIRRFSIIPNPIDTELFKFHKKSSDDRKNVLMIRSFSSRKYANDIAVKAILLLSGRPFFQHLQFSIYGKGKYFKELTSPLLEFSNVCLNETFVSNLEIPRIHRAFGIFLCPTRQDAQGVSMCEAMSSGLVPLTSHSTAIPEFVQNNETGFLSRTDAEIALFVEKLYNEPETFSRISKKASLAIHEKCSIKNIVAHELSIFD